MHSFESIKREILDRVDIVDVVSEHVALKRRGRNWLGLCPFHSEKTPSFTVSSERGTFKCFGCGKGGDVFTFVQTRENVPFIDAFRLLADRTGVELKQAGGGATASGPSRSDLASVNAWAAKFFRARLQHETIGASARQYIDNRGISAETAERFCIGLATDGLPDLRRAAERAGIDLDTLIAADLIRKTENDRTYDTFRDRLIFPIRDATKRVVGFGGRTLVDDRAKYLNTRQTALFDKGRGLYGIDLARDSISQRGRAVLVEGYTDCIAAHQAGFTETVATLGTALTDTQVDLLRRYADELILLFDSDAAGDEAANRAIRVALPRCMSTRLARIPEGKDPSDFLSTAKPEAFSDVLKGAIDALEFRWFRTLDRLAGGGSDAGRRDAVLDFLRVVAEAIETGAVDEIQRGLIVNQVAHVLNLDGREVHRLLSRLRPKRSGSTGAQSAQSGGSSGGPQGELHRAWVTLLEVALAEPGVLCEVDAVPDPGGVASACDRRLAGIVLALREQLGEFRLADVLARCDDPEDVERATELARRGAERGNFEDTLRLALVRIHRATAERETDRTRAKLLDATKSAALDENTKEELAAIQDGALRRRHYVPRRLVARAIDDPAPIAADSPQDSGSVEHP